MDRRVEQGLWVSPVSSSLPSSLAALAAPAAAQFGPPELIEAARKEGKLFFYSANVAES